MLYARCRHDCLIQTGPKAFVAVCFRGEESTVVPEPISKRISRERITLKEPGFMDSTTHEIARPENGNTSGGSNSVADLYSCGRGAVDVKGIIHPKRRIYGESCKNCVHLAHEYDLDNRSAVWVCGKPGRSKRKKALSFTRKMSCFEPSFWFTIFAPEWSATDDAVEEALDRYSKCLEFMKNRLVSPVKPLSM